MQQVVRNLEVVRPEAEISLPKLTETDGAPSLNVNFDFSNIVRREDAAVRFRRAHELPPEEAQKALNDVLRVLDFAPARRALIEIAATGRLELLKQPQAMMQVVRAFGETRTALDEGAIRLLLEFSQKQPGNADLQKEIAAVVSHVNPELDSVIREFSLETLRRGDPDSAAYLLARDLLASKLDKKMVGVIANILREGYVESLGEYCHGHPPSALHRSIFDILGKSGQPEALSLLSEYARGGRRLGIFRGYWKSIEEELFIFGGVTGIFSVASGAIGGVLGGLFFPIAGPAGPIGGFAVGAAGHYNGRS